LLEGGMYAPQGHEQRELRHEAHALPRAQGVAHGASGREFVQSDGGIGGWGSQECAVGMEGPQGAQAKDELGGAGWWW